MVDFKEISVFTRLVEVSKTSKGRVMERKKVWLAFSVARQAVVC